MNIKVNKIMCNTICSFKDTVIITYNRLSDKIELNPCCAIYVSSDKTPYSFDSDYFLKNVDKCILQYRNNINNKYLSNIYSGICAMSEYDSIKYDLCKYQADYNNLPSIEVSVSTSCNYKCKKCLARNEYNPKEYEIYKSLINHFKTIEMPLFKFTNHGEPFLYKDLLFDFLKNNKSEHITIITNGSLINQTDINLLELYKDKLDIIISLDTLNDNLYKKLTGSNCDIDKILSTIINLKNCGINVAINYVIQNENCKETEKFVDYFNKLNINVCLIKLGQSV